MAYMSQENKKSIVALAKPILKKYGIKATFAVRRNSTLVCNVKAGKIDFGSTNEQINPYWYHEHFDGKALEFLKELFAVLNKGNWDKSDPTSDYFNVGWYVDVNIGKYGKPYELV